jgi:hypothetical protein
MNYIGIDCGLDGGIAFLEPQTLRTVIMPVDVEIIKVGKKTKERRSINLLKLRDIIELCLRDSSGELTAIIENPGGHAPSAAGLRSMTYSFAVTEMCCVMLGVKYETVLSQAWQKTFWTKPKLPKLPKGEKRDPQEKFDTKAAALAVAVDIWPEHDWLASKRCKNPHDGMVDAALLALWGKNNL